MFLLLNLLFRIYIESIPESEAAMDIFVCVYVCVVFSRYMITSEASCVPFMKTTASSTSLSVPGTARTGTATLCLTFTCLCTCENSK